MLRHASSLRQRPRRRAEIPALLLAFTAACGAPEARDVRTRWREEVVRAEEEAGREPRYLVASTADRAERRHASPDSLFVDGKGRLWAGSSLRGEQVEVRMAGEGEGEGERIRLGEKRRGPRGKGRCLAGTGRLAGIDVCVGEDEPGGLVVFGPPEVAASLESALSRRAGFRDLALDGAHGLVHVLDGVDGVLRTLALDGRLVSTAALSPGADRVLALGDGPLAVFARSGARLGLLSRDGHGLPCVPELPVPRTAPSRAAVWDEARGLLWLAGPEDAEVRRADGPIRRLRSFLTAHRPEALLAGDPVPEHAIDLGRLGLVDAVDLALLGGRIAVAAAGSDRVALFDAADPSAGPPLLLDAALAPRALAAWSGLLAVAAHDDDSVLLFDLAAGASRPPLRLALDERPRDGPEEVGRRLFTRAGLTRTAAADAFSCDTCHWDGGSDGRLHPGLLESRLETTRPLDGVGQTRPIFSTAGAETLADAVEGLFRSLDDRFYAPAPAGPWWEEPREVALEGGRRVSVSASEARVALTRFVASLPVRPGPLRRPGEPLSPQAREGHALFERDCASCHAPIVDERTGRRPEDVASWLRDRPLVFAAPIRARTGAAPELTPQGTRVPPLRDLGRPWPFFTDGSAPTLDAVLRAYRPGARRVHGGEGPDVYGAADLRALRTFLLSI